MELDDIIYRAALTFKHEELAGMYAICNKREQELKEELKLIKEKNLKDEVKIVLINEKIEKLEELLKEADWAMADFNGLCARSGINKNSGMINDCNNVQLRWREKAKELVGM